MLTLTVALLVGQAGLLFLLADRLAVGPRATTAEPRVVLLTHAAEQLQGVPQPTLFVLAGPNSFSAGAWLRRPGLDFPPFVWTEPPRFLQLDTARLIGWFHQIIEQNKDRRFEIVEKAEPALDTTPPQPDQALIPNRSSLTVRGEIEHRRLLTKFDLPAWAAGDILQPTIVRVVVDANGQTHSATVLGRSGVNAADEFALALARTAEWEPLQNARPHGLDSTPTDLWVGELVFWWYTAPSTPATPQEQTN